MQENTTIRVAENEVGAIEVGTELTVSWHHVNQFNSREVISTEIGQFHRMEKTDDEWTEIMVGLDRDHEKVKFEEVN